MEGTETESKSSHPSWRTWLPLAGIVAAALVAWQTGLVDFLSLKSVAEHRDQLIETVRGNFVLALLGFAAVYAATVALSLPGGALLTILGGFLFGWMVGSIVTVIAATCGASVVFLIARTSLGETLAGRAGPWLEKLREGFRKDALSYLLFLRLVPAFPFWLVNLAPALLGMNFWPYVAGTFVGIIPGTVAFSFTGAGLDSIIEAQQKAYQDCLDGGSGAESAECTFTLEPGSLLTGEIIAAFVALGVVALVPVAVRRLRRGSE